MNTDTKKLTAEQIPAYCRVSTEEQRKKQNPIDTQREVCQQVCQQHFGDDGWSIEFFTDEGLSGTLGAKEEEDDGKYRPQYTHMLERIKAGDIRYIVTQSLDRLGRDERDIFQLRELLASQGVKVLTPSRVYDLNDPDDCLMFGIHAVMDAYQPRQTSVKSRAGKRQRARRGLLKSNNPPFGWRLQEPGEYTDPKERTIVPVPEEGEVVKKVAELYLKGWGYARIARHLAQQNAPSPGAKGWYFGIVRSLLQCPVHAGLIKVTDGEYAKGKHYPQRHWEPETFHEIQREMETRGSVLTYAAYHESFLVGTLRCGECGAPMRAKSSAHARYYQCRGDKMDPLAVCENVARKADHVEQAVINAIREFAMSEAVQQPAAQKVADMLSADDRQAQQRLQELQSKVEKLNEEIEWLIEEAARKPELRDSFDNRIKVRRDKIAEAESTLRQLRTRQGDVNQRAKQLQEIREILQDFNALWGSLDWDERRRVIRILFEDLTLSRAEGGSLLGMKPFFGERQEVFIPAMNRRDRPKHGLEALTHRECEVLYYLDDGLEIDEVADKLNVAPNAVYQHLHNIRDKLQVKTSDEAISLAREVVRQRLPRGGASTRLSRTS